jgi:hypothetical protein
MAGLQRAIEPLAAIKWQELPLQAQAIDSQDRGHEDYTLNPSAWE